MAPAPSRGQYDRDYFDHWYRKEGFGSKAWLDRKVRYVVGAAEYLLDRPVRSVLDVGCGEGAWAPAIARHRPGSRYVGVDPSGYAVERFGARRNLRLGGIGDLHRLGLEDEGPFDLIVCTDVIAYVPATDLRRGLRTIASLLGGVAFIDVYTSVDDFEGDRVNHLVRSPAVYARWFVGAGLARVGPHLYVGDALLPGLAAFEQPLR